MSPEEIKDLVMSPYRAIRNRASGMDPAVCYSNLILTPSGNYEMNSVDAFIGTFNMDISICVIEGLRNVR